MNIKTAAYAAIRSGLTDAQASELLEISVGSVRAYRAHVTMGNDSVEGQHIKTIRLSIADRKAIREGNEIVVSLTAD